MKKLVLFAFAATMFTACNKMDEYLPHFKVKEKGLNVDINVEVRNPSTDSTWECYGTVRWNPSNSSVKHITIIESDRLYNGSKSQLMGVEVGSYDVKKGQAGFDDFLVYKKPGDHYVYVFDQNDDVVGFYKYTVYPPKDPTKP